MIAFAGSATPHGPGLSSQAPVVAYSLDRYHQSSQTFVDLEIRHLRAAGVRVPVVALRRGSVDRTASDPDLLYLDQLEAGPKAWIGDHLRCLRRPRRYARFLHVVWQLRSEMGERTREHVRWWRLPGAVAVLEAKGVQHVHAHFGWSGATAAACLGALLDVPWSMTLHARDIFSRQHNLAVKLRGADLVVTVCDYNRTWLHDNVDGAVRVEVLTCGVEPPPRLTVGEPEVDVVAVARLVPKKGLDVLVRAAAELEEAGVDATVEIIGDGPCLDELRELVAALGVRSVRFLGELAHAAALERTARARVFALPCRVAGDGDRDAVPTAIIEAMARAVPIVSTTVVGIPELVDDSCGRLVAPDDHVALADALRELLDDPALGRRLGLAGAERASTQFAADRQVLRLLSLFEDTVRHRARRRSVLPTRPGGRA